ncbi:alpha/beta hydrolase [Candidatus Uhrbacteria bacterium]|nr:alpha/beta hydrolase [Candidatus Uhrbacteria bacterium]
MGKKIFIVHGWTYTTDAWNACLAELKEQGFEPVMLHVPGLTEFSQEVWDLDKYVRWLTRKLEKETEVALVGHSNGGRIAIAYAAQHHPQLARLVLIDAAGIRHNEPLLRLRRAVLGALARVLRPLTILQFARMVLYRLIGAHDYSRAPENMRETMKNLIAIDLTPHLSEVTVPTLIIWGENDRETPLSDARLMRERIRNSTLVTIPDAGHSPHATHPSEVIEKIVQSLTVTS